MGFVLISYWVSSAWATTHRSGISSKEIFLWRSLFLEEGNKRDVVEYKSNELKEREDYPLSTQVRREYDTHTEEEPNLRDYIDVILRRKWIVISCLAISVVTVAIASLLMSRIYKAEATIEIAPENPKITTFQEVVELEPQPQQTDSFYETQYKLIESKSLAKEVVSALQLDLHPEFAVKEKKPGFISFVNDSFAQILQANEKKSDPKEIEKSQLARKEGLIGSFLGRVKVTPDRKSRLVQLSFESSDAELSAKAANTLADKYIEWVLDRKLDATKAARQFLEKQLGEVKANLERAEEELSTFAKGADIVSLDEKFNLTYKQLAELNDAFSKAETERLTKEALYKEIQAGNYEYFPQVISDSSIQTLDEEHTKLKSQYDNMSVIYGPNYPEMKQLAAQLGRIQSDIKGRINGIAESIKKDYQTALTKLNMLLATLMGLMGGVFLAFIFEHFDNTIKDEEEVKRRFSLPFLGAIPLVDGNELQDLEKVVYANPKSLVSEAFRVIRTSILYSSPNSPPKSLLITSTQPLEGKTTCASNLALSFTQSGLKVALIDADLRKPRLHKLFLNNGYAFGLSTYLVGKMELSGVINRTSLDGLDIITSGPIPPNPAELLGSKRMKELIEHLLEEYDHVILDGPPIAGFSDSRLLSSVVDGVLLVTSIGITQRQTLRSSIEDILRVRGRIIGTIVNRLESRRSKYGYSYYYYYNNEEGKRKKSNLHLPHA